MAARTKASKAPSKTTKARRTTASRLERIEAELPENLRDFTKQVRRQLDRVEKEIEQANTQARRHLARLIRDASHLLGRVEERGPARWRSLTTPYRRDAQRLLKRLERAVAPAARRRKAPARKRASKALPKA